MYKKLFFIFGLFLLSASCFLYVCRGSYSIAGEIARTSATKKIATTPDQLEMVVIIGSGPAGLTAALYAAQAGLRPLVITGKDEGGQLTKTAAVKNWPGIEEVSGKDLMDSLFQHAKGAGARFLFDEVIAVNFSEKPFVLKTKQKIKIKARAVIIATGSTPRMLNIPGEEQYWGNGISNCAICDGALYKNKKVVIIGGGNTAFENVLYLKNFTNDITIIHKDDTLGGFATNREKIMGDTTIRILYDTIATEFCGDMDGFTHLIIENKKTKQKTMEKFDGVFLSIGSKPNTDMFKNSLELTKFGYIKTHNQVETSLEGIFAIGDVRETRYRQAIISAGDGSLAALEAEKYLKKPLPTGN